MGTARVFSAEFKVGVARRLGSGESATALQVEFGIKRGVLYRWRDAYNKEGEGGVSRGVGRPPGSGTKVAAATRAVGASAAKVKGVADPQAERIAELERVIGKQAMQIDFLARAFKRIKESRQEKDATGVAASTGRSGQ